MALSRTVKCKGYTSGLDASATAGLFVTHLGFFVEKAAKFERPLIKVLHLIYPKIICFVGSALP